MHPLPIIDPEFKGLIPPLAQEEREQLEQNIVTSRKCHDPITLWEGTIIDGHNRFEICIQHGVEFQIKEMPLPTREAAKVWILENQLNRRNLTDAARIELALLKASYVREKAQKEQKRAGGDRKSGKYEKSLMFKSSKPKNDTMLVRRAIATDADVSESTVHRYAQITERGSPELLAKVQSGKLKIGAAHKLLPEELTKQLLQANKLVKYIAHAIPETGCAATNPGVHDKLTNVTALLRDLLNDPGWSSASQPWSPPSEAARAGSPTARPCWTPTRAVSEGNDQGNQGGDHDVA